MNVKKNNLQGWAASIITINNDDDDIQPEKKLYGPFFLNHCGPPLVFFCCWVPQLSVSVWHTMTWTWHEMKWNDLEKNNANSKWLVQVFFFFFFLFLDYGDWFDSWWWHGVGCTIFFSFVVPQIRIKCVCVLKKWPFFLEKSPKSLPIEVIFIHLISQSISLIFNLSIYLLSDLKMVKLAETNWPKWREFFSLFVCLFERKIIWFLWKKNVTVFVIVLHWIKIERKMQMFLDVKITFLLI